jgi:hypothetical protein
LDRPRSAIPRFQAQKKVSLNGRIAQQAISSKDSIMSDTTQLKHSGSFDLMGLDRHVNVRYRCTPPNHGRVFIANSSKSVDALVVYISEDSIGLIVNTYIEAGSLVRIEMGDSGKVPYVDLAATIKRTSQLEDGKWQCDCEWVRALTPDELLVPQHCSFQTPHRRGPYRQESPAKWPGLSITTSPGAAFSIP